MKFERGSSEEAKAALLVIRAWRDPANQDIRSCFKNDVLLFDAFVRASATGHVKRFSTRPDPLEEKLLPIIASMAEIDF